MTRQEQFFTLEELIDAVCTCAELVIKHGPEFFPFMRKLEQEIERHEDVVQRAKDVLVRYGRPIPEPIVRSGNGDADVRKRGRHYKRRAYQTSERK